MTPGVLLGWLLGVPALFHLNPVIGALALVAFMLGLPWLNRRGW